MRSHRDLGWFVPMKVFGLRQERKGRGLVSLRWEGNHQGTRPVPSKKPDSRRGRDSEMRQVWDQVAGGVDSPEDVVCPALRLFPRRLLYARSPQDVRRAQCVRLEYPTLC